MRHFALPAMLGCVLLVVCPAGLAAEGGMPVVRVTAFNSGVAYFEHAGKVTGDATVLLKFKPEQINDLLKSLVVTDPSGEVTGISYASQEPLSRALKSFGVDLSAQPSLAELLKQLRGAEVRVAGPELVVGKILGVEKRTEHLLPSNRLLTTDVLNVLTAEGIKAIDLKGISSIRLVDERLNAELNKALALLVESRDTHRKALSINFAGKGQREVRIGYVTEAPVWKTSYRLILGEKEVRLQGWAIVENTSDFDWSNCQLTLVSGRPISFVQDLYTPLYLPRPVVQPELYASLRPQRYAEGLAAAEKPRMLAEKADFEYRRKAAAKYAAAPRPTAAPGRLLGRGLARDKARQNALKALSQGVRSLAAAKQVGELFAYPIKTPVNLPRRKSAMLPIVNQPIKARKLSIYNAAVLARHPLNGLWLTNDTELTLLAGPVTVFEAGSYAGDAQIDNLNPGDKRLLSYAIDLKVTVDASESSSRKVTSVTIVRGILRISRRHTYSKTYTIKNKDSKKRTVLIEHPRRSGLKLLKPAKPAEQTANLYRFEVEVPGKETGRFVVQEERPETETLAIFSANVGTLKYYSTDKTVSPKVREALAEAVKRRNALAQAEAEQRELQRRISRLQRDQGVVRANVTALSRNPTSASYKRFEKKLLEIQDKLDALQAKLEEAQAKVKSLRKELEDYLVKLTLE